MRTTDRVLYVLNPYEIDKADRDVSPFDIESVTMYAPKYLATRIGAQMGMFTVHPTPGSPFKHETLERWIIKGDAIIDLAVTLDMFGFNPATMFPDLEGLAKHINEWTLPGIREELA